MAEKEYPNEEISSKLEYEELVADGGNDESEQTEEDEENEEEEKEEDDEEDIDVKRVKRCERRKKQRRRKITVEEIDVEVEEEGEVDEGEEEEDVESEVEYEGSLSEYSSILSAVSFIWEDEQYEFLDLCDPGTMDDIFYKRPVSVALDLLGAETYLYFCDKLKIAPIVRFYNSLDTNESNLTFHGINKHQMKAICAALELNRNVKVLILRENILSSESCRHLALLLSRNGTITDLDLSGCKIGPEGAAFLSVGIMKNETLRELNLSKCNIQNEGMTSLMPALTNNIFLEKLVLSYNKLGSVAADALGTIFTSNNSIKFVDLDYNDLYDPVGMKKFFKGLHFNSFVTNLHLRWNAMSAREIGEAVSQFLRRNTSVQYLDLSDNRFDGVSIRSLRRGLAKSESLEILRLARNPLAPRDVEYLLPAVKTAYSLRLLDLGDIWVGKEYLKILKKVQRVKEIEIIIGGVYSNYTISPPDYPALILKRAQFEAMKPKKKKAKKDFGHLMFMLGDELLTQDQFMKTVKKFKAKVNKTLYPELIKQFTVPKLNLIDVVSMRRKYLSLFPDSKPPQVKKRKGVVVQEVIQEKQPVEGKIEGEEALKEQEYKDLVTVAEEANEEERTDLGEQPSVPQESGNTEVLNANEETLAEKDEDK